MTAPQKQWSKEQWTLVRYNGRLIVRQGDAVVFDEAESPLTESQWQFICERVNFCAGVPNVSAFLPLDQMLTNSRARCNENVMLEAHLNSFREYVHELTGNEGEDDALTVLKAHITSLTHQAEANKEAMAELSKLKSDLVLLMKSWTRYAHKTTLSTPQAVIQMARELNDLLSQPSPVEAQEDRTK